MAITILPKEEGFGGRLGTAFGTGLGQALQGLAEGKTKQLQAQHMEQAGLPGILAYLDPKIASAYLKQYGAAQQLAQRQPQIQDQLLKLRQLEESGEVGERAQLSPFRLLFGKKLADSDLADITAQQLQKLLPKGEVVPSNWSKLGSEARQELLAQLEQKYGAQQPQQMMQQTQGQPMMGRPQEEQPQQFEGPLASLLRTGLGAGLQSTAALANLVPGYGGPLSAGIIGSDFLSALEPEHVPDSSEEKLAKLDPQEREWYEIIKKTQQEKGSLKDYLPSTRNIKRLVGAVLPDDLITPRSNEEKLIADSVSKLTGLMSFGKMGFPKALASTGVGIGGRELFKEAVGRRKLEKSKWGPLAESTAEFLFTMMPPVLWNSAREKVSQLMGSDYNSFDKSAAARQQIPVEDILQKSKDLRKEAAKYESLRSNKNLVETLEDFEKQAADGKMRLSEAVKAKRFIDRTINEANLDPTAEGVLKGFRRELRNKIHSEGAKLDADGFQYLKRADEINTGLEGSKTIVEDLRDSIKKGNPKSLYLRTLISRYPEAAIAGLSGQLVGLPILKAAAPVVIGKELAQLYKFYRNTPTAWKELVQAGLDSVKGNKQAAIARLASIDRKALKDEKKRSRFLTRR